MDPYGYFKPVMNTSSAAPDRHTTNLRRRRGAMANLRGVTQNKAKISGAGLLLPWEPTTFIFWGYNPYFGGVKPSFFMVLGSKGSY